MADSYEMHLMIYLSDAAIRLSTDHVCAALVEYMHRHNIAHGDIQVEDEEYLERR